MVAMCVRSVRPVGTGPAGEFPLQFSDLVAVCGAEKPEKGIMEGTPLFQGTSGINLNMNHQ